MTPAGSHRPFFSSSTLLPLVSVVLLVVVGFVVADDYGTSQDEYANYLVGADALQAYTSPGQFLDYIKGGDPLAHHGPAYFMLWAVTSKVWEEVVPWWTRPDGRHFTNFLMYVVSVVGVYALSVRLMERRYAWMTSVLFATQPLLFGHAFINQKDTPFMAFFVLSVVVGLAVVDRLGRRPIEGEQAGGSWRGLSEAWRRVRGVRKWLGVVALGMMVLVVVDLLFTERLLWGLRWLAVRGAGGDVGQVGQMVVDLDKDAVRTAVEHAVLGVTWAYWAGRGLIVVGAVAIGALVLWWLMPAEMGRWWRRYGKEIGWVVLAGGLGGGTVSIRPIGGFAAVLVGMYWLYRLRGRGGWLLGVYGGVALLVMYMTWPYLWDAPVAKLTESLGFTTEFEGKSILYRGSQISSRDLPWHYLPTLASIELTESMVGLFAVGAGAAVWRWMSRRIDPSTLGALVVWLAVPVAAVILNDGGVYGNIRHMLFVLVPVSVIAGIGLEAALMPIRSRAIQSVILALVVLPGLIGISQLHPYEYAYFNSFVGGLNGADGKYETEHWCSAYRELMERVNEVAPDGAVVWSPQRAASEFARADLEVVTGDERVDDAMYVLACENAPDLKGFRQIWEVGRGSAVFAEVYQRAAP